MFLLWERKTPWSSQVSLFYLLSIIFLSPYAVLHWGPVAQVRTAILGSSFGHASIDCRPSWRWVLKWSRGSSSGISVWQTSLFTAVFILTEVVIMANECPAPSRRLIESCSNFSVRFLFLGSSLARCSPEWFDGMVNLALIYWYKERRHFTNHDEYGATSMNYNGY